jgi:hypothetical protein
MTPERRLLIDVTDVKAIVFECGHCGGRVTVPADKTVHGDHLIRCQPCGKNLLQDYTAAAPYLSLLKTLQALVALQPQSQLRARMEVDDVR